MGRSPKRGALPRVSAQEEIDQSLSRGEPFVLVLPDGKSVVFGYTIDGYLYLRQVRPGMSPEEMCTPVEQYGDVFDNSVTAKKLLDWLRKRGLERFVTLVADGTKLLLLEPFLRLGNFHHFLNKCSADRGDKDAVTMHPKNKPQLPAP